MEDLFNQIDDSIRKGKRMEDVLIIMNGKQLILRHSFLKNPRKKGVGSFTEVLLRGAFRADDTPL